MSDLNSDALTGDIHCGDCIDVLESMPDECIDLTVFSPPYDGIRDYNGDWKLNIGKLGQETFRVSKDGAIAAIVIGDGTKDFAKSLTTFRWALQWVDIAGWKLFECCIYSRRGRPGAWWAQRFRVDHEYILLFFKGTRPKFFDKKELMIDCKYPGDVRSGGRDRRTSGGFAKQSTKITTNPKKCRGTVWNYSTSMAEGNRTKLMHPATYPDKLARDLILCFSKEGDTVLDPMAGSGTTAIIAANNRRNYVGIEISKEYVEIIRKRIDNEVNAKNHSTQYHCKKPNRKFYKAKLA